MFAGLTFAVHGSGSARQNIVSGLLVKHGATIVASGQSATHVLLPSIELKPDASSSSTCCGASVVDYAWVTQCIKCKEMVPLPSLLSSHQQAEPPKKLFKRRKLRAAAGSAVVVDSSVVEWSPVAVLSPGAALCQFQGSVASVLPLDPSTSRGTDHLTAYQLRDAQGDVVRLNIFSLPGARLPALQVADSVRLRNIRAYRDSSGELSLCGCVGPLAFGRSAQPLQAEIERSGAFPWSEYPTAPCFSSLYPSSAAPSPSPAPLESARTGGAVHVSKPAPPLKKRLPDGERVLASEVLRGLPESLRFPCDSYRDVILANYLRAVASQPSQLPRAAVFEVRLPIDLTVSPPTAALQQACAQAGKRPAALSESAAN